MLLIGLYGVMVVVESLCAGTRYLRGAGGDGKWLGRVDDWPKSETCGGRKQREAAGAMTMES